MDLAMSLSTEAPAIAHDPRRQMFEIEKFIPGYVCVHHSADASVRMRTPTVDIVLSLENLCSSDVSCFSTLSTAIPFHLPVNIFTTCNTSSTLSENVLNPN